MMVPMNALNAVEVDGPSPLETARTSRGLTREEAAVVAALSADEIAWVEEGRLYRFRSAHAAVAAVATYAAALGLEHREALELAGRPVPPRTPDSRRSRMLVAAGALVVVVAFVAALVAIPRLGGSDTGRASANLPPRWRVKVDVLNGSGDRNYTQKIADRVGAKAYQLDHIGRVKGPFNYQETAVYYPPRAEELARRLRDDLCLESMKPLPGGTDRRRLVVIVGPPAVSGC
jgi:Helix-turn-helix domain/LytR cell envelope-related transcriptional attenuator